MLREPLDPKPSSRIAIALDVCAVLVGAGMVAMSLKGGLQAVLGGVRLSAHGPIRVTALLLLIVAARLLFFRRAPPFGLGREALLRIRVYLYNASTDGAANHPVSTRYALWAFGGLCVFCAVVLRRQVLHMDSVSDLGDPLLSIWRMEWFYHWLHGDPRPLFSPNIFYPTPLTFTFSDSMLLPSLTAMPLLLAGIHPVVAYNVLLLSGFLLSGFAVYLLVVRLTGLPRAAFVSAILFACYPFRFEHYAHLELQMMQWIPLALLAIHRFLATLKPRYIFAASLCAVAQLYSSMYFAVFFLLFAVPVVAVLLVVMRPPLTRLWRTAIGAALLASALAVPLARPYAAAQPIKGDRDIDEVTKYSADPIDYLKPHPRNTTYYGVMPGNLHPERALFPGFMAPLLAAVALVPPIGSVELAYGAGLLLAFDGSLGFHGVSYPYLYKWLPPIRGLRVPARFSAIVGLALAILAGFGCRRIFNWCRSPVAGGVVLAAIIGAMGVDFRQRIDLVHVWPAPPAIYSKLIHQPRAVLVEFPMQPDDGNITPNVSFMYFSIWHWTNMVNGYSGFAPPAYNRFLESFDTFPSDTAIDALVARGVTHVTLNCALYGPNCQEELLKPMDASPRLKLMVTTRWEGDVARLYEIER